MKKVYLLLAGLSLLVSCEKNNLKKEIESQKIVIDSMNKELRERNALIMEQQNKIINQVQKLEKYEKEESMTKVTDDFDNDSYLVYSSGMDMIPKGFVKTTGYLDVLDAKIAKYDNSIEGYTPKDGTIFYITDTNCPLNKYINEIKGKKIFFNSDENGNPGLTVSLDDYSKEMLLKSSIDNHVNVIITLPDLKPMSAPAFVPMGKVYYDE